MEYKLKHPFKGLDKSRTVQSVMMRRINAGDLLVVDDADSDMVQMGKLIARLTGLDYVSEVPQLDLEDWNGLQEIVKKQQTPTKSGE